MAEFSKNSKGPFTHPIFSMPYRSRMRFNQQQSDHIFTNLWLFFVGLFSIWQNFEPNFANILCFLTIVLTFDKAANKQKEARHGPINEIFIYRVIPTSWRGQFST